MREFIFDSLNDAQLFLKSSIEKNLQEQVEKFGEGLLILPGGNSIKSFYKSLADMKVDWNRIWITLSDERLVPLNSDMSNEKQLKDLFLSRLDFYNYLPIIELDLKKKLEKYPPITVLSMGKDGHIASLFPDEVEYWDSCEDIIYYTKFQTPNRVSLTKRTISLSSKIFILILGERKLSVFIDDNKKIFKAKWLKSLAENSIIVGVRNVKENY